MKQDNAGQIKKKHAKSKVRIGKKRYWMMGGLLLGMLVLLSALIRSGNSGREVIKKERLLDYTYQSSASYEVCLIPNDYIADDRLGMDQKYIRKLVDHVEATVAASYEGSKEAKLSGDCRVDVRLRGYQMDDGKKDIIWEKQMEVLSDKPVEENGSTYGLTQTAAISLDAYEAAAEAAMEELDVSSSLEAVVELKGELALEKDGEKAKLPLEASVCIPLTGGRFEIEHSGEVSGADVIERTQTVSEESMRGREILLGILLAVMLVLFFLLLFFTGDYTMEQKKSRRLAAVFRTYGSQLTSLLVYPPEQGIEIYQVDGIRELFKVAEELHRPVFYASTEKPHGRVICFFVQEEGRRYLYGESQE